MRPEVPEVGAHSRSVAIDELIREVELMEGLVPELALRVGGEHPVAGTGQRRRDHDRAYEERSMDGAYARPYRVARLLQGATG